MQVLEKILKEIDVTIGRYKEIANMEAVDICYGMKVAKKIIRQHMNDGWIPVNSYGLPSSSEHDFRFWVTVRYKNGFRRTLKATWNYFDNHFVYQNGKMILEDVVAYRYYSAPDPYRPERSKE